MTDAPAVSIPPPALSGTALELVAQFLLPKDIGRATSVCKFWKEDFRASNSFVWKQSALNVEPRVVQAILDDAESRDEGDHIDFYRLAVGFSQQHNGGDSKLSGRKRKAKRPEPTFRIENLLIVVELKREIVSKDKDGQEFITYETLGVFLCNDCSGLMEQNFLMVRLPVPESRAFTIKGPNFLHPDGRAEDSGMSEYEANFKKNLRKDLLERMAGNDYPRGWKERFLAPVTIAGIISRRKIFASSFLVRRDIWRTFCLFKHVYMIGAYRSVSVPGEPSEGLHCRARGEFYCGTRKVLPHTAIHFTPFPSPGSNDEPACLHKIRTTADPAQLNWTQQDEEELSSIRDFSFRLHSLSLSLETCPSYYGGAENLETPSIWLLENLSWK